MIRIIDSMCAYLIKDNAIATYIFLVDLKLLTVELVFACVVACGDCHFCHFAFIFLFNKLVLNFFFFGA